MPKVINIVGRTDGVPSIHDSMYLRQNTDEFLHNFVTTSNLGQARKFAGEISAMRHLSHCPILEKRKDKIVGMVAYEILLLDYDRLKAAKSPSLMLGTPYCQRFYVAGPQV